MGTNFYWLEKPPCPTCGHEGEELHIGKSSAGWVFALHVDFERGINTLEDWIARFYKPDSRIRDEYGTYIPAHEMVNMIAGRSSKPRERDPSFHATNHSEDGPQGLLRARIDGRHCIRHGPGTWDYHPGEFS